MSTPYTPNKNLALPAHNSFQNDWDVPLNSSWASIDLAFGGTTTISVTGVTTPNILFTTAQYTPPNIEFTGVLSATLTYYVPTGVGGIWSIYNGTTGAFNLIIANDTALTGTVMIPQGYRSLCLSDGTSVALAQTPTTSFTQLTDNIANKQVPASAVEQYQHGLSLSGTQIMDGTVSSDYLPPAGKLGGVVIAPDPGVAPVGGMWGTIYYYYGLLLAILCCHAQGMFV